MTDSKTRARLHPAGSRSRLPARQRKRRGHVHSVAEAARKFDWGAVVKASHRKGWPRVEGPEQ